MTLKELKQQFIDHRESVCEELTLNGYNVKLIDDKIIQCEAIFGSMDYNCTEKTVMGDFYRFLSHYGSKLHYYALKERVKESSEIFKKEKGL